MYENILSKFEPYNRTPIGTGGFAEIYRGFSEQLGIDVAIKILKKEYHNNKTYLAKFTNEARKIAGINHPNIIRIYDNQLEDFYYVMGLLDSTLAEKLKARGGSLNEGKTIRLAIDITSALRELASQTNYERGNVIHRDLKPSNIMFNFDGNAVLTDFGISVFEDEVPDLVAGTPQYMSPEQFEKGRKLDSRSDLYSLGVVLYQVSTSHLPFKCKNKDEYRDKHLNEKPKDPSTLFSGINPELAEVILQLLEKKPENRYPSAHSLLKKLELIKENYKNKRTTKFLGHLRNNETAKAIKIGEEFLRDVDPSDRYFQDELAKLKFSSILENSKSRLISLDPEGAKEELKKAELTRENKADEDYLTLKQDIRIVDNCYKELSRNLENEDIANALVNFKDIDQIVSNYGKKKSFEKIEYYRNLLAILENAQTIYNNENYSSALVEYSRAQEIDQNNLVYIRQKIEELEEKIQGYNSELASLEKSINEYPEPGKILDLKKKFEQAIKSTALFDSQNRKKLNLIYHNFLVIQGLDFSKRKEHKSALECFRKARDYFLSGNIEKNIMLMEMLQFEQDGKISSAITNCEILIESIEGNPDEPAQDTSDIADDYNLQFLKQKMIELEIKQSLQDDFEAIERKIKLKKTEEATKSLEALKNKITDNQNKYKTIDLSEFESQIGAWREKIIQYKTPDSTRTPTSTVFNTTGTLSQFKKSKKGIFSIATRAVAAILFIGIIYAGVKYLPGVIGDQAPPDQMSPFEITAVPGKSLLYIDDNLQPLEFNGGIVKDSLAAGEHTFLLQNPRFKDTSFVATLFPDSSNLFSMAKWSLAKIKVELVINPMPDRVEVNNHVIKSTTDTFSFFSHPGQTTVRIAKNGFKTNAFNLQLTKGDAVKKTVELTPAPPGGLKIIVSPFATIRIDDQVLAKDIKKLERNDFAAGNHTLALIHPSFGTFKTNIVIQSGQQNIFAYNLENECGELVITILDENGQKTFANIFIDGEIAANEQDFLKVKKTPGSYQISAEKEGYDRAASTLSAIVAKGKLTREIIRLKK